MLPASPPLRAARATLAAGLFLIPGATSGSSKPEPKPSRPTATAADKPKAGAAAPGDIFPYRVEEKTLANGLRVLAVPTDHPGIVSFYIVVRAGSRNEIEPGHTGFAHFFEHMMFRGTKKYPADAYNLALKRLGADNNAFTTDDFTCYHTTAAAASLETLMDLESDRFRNLSYGEPEFQKEARAVLGEYNKGASSPFQVMEERLLDTAFTTHTYKHTTIGFLKDIEDMPNQYDYSRTFFDRFYRPENCILLVVGDVPADRTFALAAKYWGSWKRGEYVAKVPAEPAQDKARSIAATWPTPTLPYLMIAFKAPAFSATEKTTAALDLIGQGAFGTSSTLYKKLVIEEQRLDMLRGGYDDHRDPHLFLVTARLKSKDEAMSAKVQAEIEATLAALRTTPVDAKHLAEVKSALKYGMAMRLDTTDGIAVTLARYLSLTGDPASINQVFRTYDAIGPDDLMAVARRTFVDTGRTTLTLTEEASQ